MLAMTAVKTQGASLLIADGAVWCADLNQVKYCCGLYVFSPTVENNINSFTKPL